MRPISLPVLTNRLEEREVTYSPQVTDSILVPPIPTDEVKDKKKQRQHLGRIPLPRQSSCIQLMAIALS